VAREYCFCERDSLAFCRKKCPSKGRGRILFEGSVLGEKRCNEVMNALLYG